MAEKQIVGVTGLARAGKSELLTHLSYSYGFKIVSPSSVIHDFMREQTGRDTFGRSELRAAGTALRKERGLDFIVDAVEQSDEQRIVVDGIRNLVAARSFMRIGGRFIGLVARAEVRYARSLAAGDGKLVPGSVEAMLKDEHSELSSADRNGLHLLPILWSIDPQHIIDSSDMTISEVQQEADKILQEWQIAPVL